MKRFQNRKTAGRELAEKLVSYKSFPGIVLGIPRGGIPVAHEISHALHWPLGLVWVKKIGHPFSPEMAIGAVTETEVLLGADQTLSDPYIQSAVKGIRDRFTEMKMIIHDPTDKMDIRNKHIIIVDDGIATGHTLLAAIRHLRKKDPVKIIVAIPVAPHDAVVKLEDAADDVIVLYQPEYFSGISAFYEEFDQLATEEVAAFFKNHIHQWLD
ncbi:MAG: phosphoribosyltransferase [Bacteroidota bacterium]|jgi:putative phosphoribosyl transferase